MPKKTKQEKIIAELRRKLAETDSGKIEERSKKMDNEEGKLTSGNYKFDPSSLVSNIQPHNPSSNILASPAGGQPQISTIYIKRDLLKTLFLSIFALGFELVIYWAWSH